MTEAIADLERAGICVKRELPLRRYCTFRIGGNARYAVFPKKRAELLAALRMLMPYKDRVVLIGKGSNVLFSDDGFDGAVIFTTECKEIVRTRAGFYADAGASLAVLACEARDASLGGLEFAHGIPGTLGGGVLMNAGAYGGELSTVCVASEYFDLRTGEVCRLHGAEHEWGYRKSYYSEHPEAVILGAELVLTPADPEQIRARMQELTEKRKASQPIEYAGAGSTFKRPEGTYAGKLIEDCGLKGMSVGDAQVSQKHAGFIINRGNANANDVKELIGIVQERVRECFGVELECEIRML